MIYRENSSKLAKKRPCKIKPSFKRRTNEQVLQEVRSLVKCSTARWVFKEEIATKLGVPQKQVELALQRLNIEGLISKPSHSFPHDCNRNPYAGGSFSSWQADIYSVKGIR